jgi:hypothetical protein
MPLAAILALYAIFGPYSTPSVSSVQPTAIQESQPQQQAPTADSSQEPSKPTEQDRKPDQSAAPTQTPAPGALVEEPQNPPPDATPKSENPRPDSTGKKPAGKIPSPTGVKTGKRSRKHKPAAQPSSAQPGSTPSKTVVREGSTTDPLIQISPSATEEEASHERQNTDQLLASTDANLKKVSGRQLNSSQQDMVNQIRNYIEQAKAASDARDLQRAHNLAFKAHLLSDELAKQ